MTDTQRIMRGYIISVVLIFAAGVACGFVVRGLL
jgi:hypothetical protein